MQNVMDEVLRTDARPDAVAAHHCQSLRSSENQ